MRSVVGLFWVLRQGAWDLIQFVKVVNEGSALKGLTDNSNHIQSASLDQSWQVMLNAVYFSELSLTNGWVNCHRKPEISQLKGTLHKGEAGRVYITSDNYMCLNQGTLRAQSSATDCRHITGKHAPPSLSRTACKPQQPKPVVTFGGDDPYTVTSETS